MEKASFPGKVDYLGGREQAQTGGGGGRRRQVQGAQSAGQCPQGHQRSQLC